VVVDPLTVRITLKEPYVPFLTSLSSGFDTFPVVPKGSVPGGRETMTMYPPGTGPFIMTEYKQNQSLLFKKFDQYWQKGIPYLDAVDFKVVSDPTVRFTALRAGDFDVIERLTYEQVLRVQKGEIKDIGLDFAEGSGYRALIFNTEKPPFNSVKLRQAVAYAIDKAKMNETITWGFGSVTTQKVPKNSPWWVPIEDRKRDLARARALMKEAGYPSGLKVVSQVSKGWPNPEVMQIVQSQLKEVGIEIEIEFIDFARNQQIKRTGEFQFVPLGGLTYPDPDLAYYQYFHTEQTPIKVSNFPRYSNPKVDKLLEQGRVEPDFQKRYRIYKEFFEIIHEEVPQISLGSTPYVFGYRNYVKGFEVFPDDHFYYGVGGIGMTWMDR
jgi:peptide/nickel transport system substrate-binding protein